MVHRESVHSSEIEFSSEMGSAQSKRQTRYPTTSTESMNLGTPMPGYQNQPYQPYQREVRRSEDMGHVPTDQRYALSGPGFQSSTQPRQRQQQQFDRRSVYREQQQEEMKNVFPVDANQIVPASKGREAETESIVKRRFSQPLVHERVESEELVEEQPVIERERLTTEVRPIVEKQVETVELPCRVIESEKPMVLRELVATNAPNELPTFTPDVQSGCETISPRRRVIQKEPVIRERRIHTVLEDIHPVIERDLHETTIHKVLIPYRETIIEAPIMLQPEIIERRISARAASGWDHNGYGGERGQFVQERDQDWDRPQVRSMYAGKSRGGLYSHQQNWSDRYGESQQEFRPRGAQATSYRYEGQEQSWPGQQQQQQQQYGQQQYGRGGGGGWNVESINKYTSTNMPRMSQLDNRDDVVRQMQSDNSSYQQSSGTEWQSDRMKLSEQQQQL